ncbi:hypothetical protein [Gemmatimonas sp.]|uniref:hypothetical protein n=1 Tax=Gemmatimonas sp. TaxID=1962908 RepID=UPI0022CB8AD7|nr:hypothetical protein [Gemmatimonas sp.]MCZ8203889.1 hypothetical protein [Gemmatimonas sp.]
MRPVDASLALSARRSNAARSALALCISADALAREMEGEVASTVDDDRFFALLAQHELLLQDLAEQLVVLRQERPTADSALFAATERVVDDADALVGDVCAAVETTHHLTMELAAKVGRRAEALRNELESVQRASTAGAAYGTAGGARLVDRRR